MNEDALRDLAQRQHGLATTTQIRRLGGTRQLIATRVRVGKWRRARRGVVVIGAVPPSWKQQVMAACLAGGSGVTASHRTAARLWQLVERSGRIELLAGDDRHLRLNAVRVHRSCLYPTLDQTLCDGIPVTTTARTIVDLAPVQGDERVVGIWIDAALRAGTLDLLELRSCLARVAGPGRGDVTCLRDALARRLPGYDPGDSDLEIRALTALHDAAFPPPVQQHRVACPSGPAFLDLAYPAHKVAIELDGWEHHGRRSAFDRDRARRNELTVLGWRVFQFTASMPNRVLTQTIGEAIGHAAANQPPVSGHKVATTGTN